jgi:hypothetical protein
MMAIPATITVRPISLVIGRFAILNNPNSSTTADVKSWAIKIKATKLAAPKRGMIMVADSA